MLLPVVNDDKKVIGVVTYNDVMNAVGKADGLKISMEVADIMKIVPCIYTYEDEATTLNVMRRNKSAHLPVVDTENHLEGVISFMVLARRIIQFKRRMGRSEKSDIGNLEMSF